MQRVEREREIRGMLIKLISVSSQNFFAYLGHSECNFLNTKTTTIVSPPPQIDK